MKYLDLYLSFSFKYGKKWWMFLTVLLFITPKKIVLDSQVINKKPINNSIQGRCY